MAGSGHTWPAMDKPCWSVGCVRDKSVSASTVRAREEEPRCVRWPRRGRFGQGRTFHFAHVNSRWLLNVQVQTLSCQLAVRYPNGRNSWVYEFKGQGGTRLSIWIWMSMEYRSGLKPWREWDHRGNLYNWRINNRRLEPWDLPHSRGQLDKQGGPGKEEEGQVPWTTEKKKFFKGEMINCVKNWIWGNWEENKRPLHLAKRRDLH